ncbi:hypothetical protein [Maribacter sp. 2307ULW6-5]
MGQQDKDRQDRKPKRRSIGLYIIGAVLVVMVLFYLVLVNGVYGT